MASINYKQKKYGSITPGPGTYKPKFVREINLSFSLGQKLEGEKENKTTKIVPGPGSYNPRPIYKSYGNTTFGTGKRRGLYDERKAKLVPSANTYNPNSSVTQKTAAKFSFGSAK